jgi:hypothetical protein
MTLTNKKGIGDTVKMFNSLKNVAREVPEYFSLAIKLILALSIINAVYFRLWHVMSTNIFLLAILILPQIIKRSYKIEMPKEFEIILLGFVIFTFFVGSASTTLAPIAFGIATSMIAFIILLILYTNNQIKKNYFLILLFAFNFAIAFGFGLEFLKYWLKFLLGHELSPAIYAHAMRNMTYVIAGAAIACIIGLIYMKTKKGILRRTVEKFISMNPKLKGKETMGEIRDLIKEGENEKLEFKSTLRINLHTNEIDRRVEHSVLKTIVAFLNSNGGTLLLGVSDKSDISGIEKDQFPNVDKFNLHLTNLIKQRIGKKYLRLINIESIEHEGITIVKVVCKKNDKQVFLQTGQDEEFFARAGPSTSQISGNELIEYIKNHFDEK